MIAAALFCVGVAGSTTALFTAEVTSKTSTFGGGWVGSPTNLAVAGPNGADMTVTWTTPTTTGVQGYAVMGTNMGTTAVACPTTPYPVTITTLVAPAATYTATNAASQTDDGYYYCYQVRSYWTTNSWYGTNPSQPANATRIGLYTTAASISNGSGNITKADSVILTFNQSVTTAATIGVMACTNGTVLIGASACGTTPSIGTFTLSGATIGSSQSFPSSTVTGSPGTTLNIAFGATGSPSATITGTQSWTFTPSASLQSTNGTTKAPGCTGAPCVFSATGTF